MAKKSAQRSERRNQARRMLNRAAKSKVRTSIKKFEAALQANDKAAADTLMHESFKLLDSAANKGVMHRNTVDRKKSRMAHAFNKLA